MLDDKVEVKKEPVFSLLSRVSGETDIFKTTLHFQPIMILKTLSFRGEIACRNTRKSKDMKNVDKFCHIMNYLIFK